MRVVFLFLLAGLISCAPTDQVEAQKTEGQMFLSKFSAHCGKAYEGKVVSTDERDADFASERLIMHVRFCSEDNIRIPFHVGENRSRTWVLSQVGDQLRLKHDHRHEDGEEDAVTQYGGDSVTAPNNGRVEFPVDQYSIDLFQREGLDQSITNVWAIEISKTMFAYELSRESRFFRVEFDLTTPVAAPPAPWGAR